MNTFTAVGAKCSQIPNEAPIDDFVLPFDAKTEAVCTHSTGSGSHSGKNAFYALDLATNYVEPAAIIRASGDGIAYVFGADPNGLPCSSDSKIGCALCPEPPGTPEAAQASTCGQSWGNHIRILHKNGYVSFYVHLDHPLVRSGIEVHKGDPIGVEGWTGAAGHRHLHWSIQKLPGSEQADWVKHISWTGESVPFHFKANRNGRIQTIEASELTCAHAGIGHAPSDQQPRFIGVN